MGMIKGVAVAMALTLGLGAAQAQEKPAGKLKVGFIYVGPVADFGYSFQHDQSRKALLAAMPDKVETSFLENVPEADSERSIESLARSGHQLIFTTSFGFMEPTLKVAKKFPTVKFEHATGYKRSANVSTYSARFYEGRYICGEIAARLSKTGTVGYIASFPIPEVVSGINAFMLGAQSVNPNIKLKIVWVNTWFDPGKEAEAAKALLAQGADILSQHTDSAAPLQEAEKQGKFAFGQSSDQMRFAPKAQLTSIVGRLGWLRDRRGQGRSRRHLEKPRHLGRDQGGHGGAGALRQHARRREGQGRGLQEGDPPTVRSIPSRGRS